MMMLGDFSDLHSHVVVKENLLRSYKDQKEEMHTRIEGQEVSVCFSSGVIPTYMCRCIIC